MQSMGFIVAIGMFIGAGIFDGKIEETKKGLAVTLSYGGSIIWITVMRVYYTLDSIPPGQRTGNMANAYNGISTIIFVSLFWFIGVYLGVVAYKYRKPIENLVQTIIKNYKK